MTDDHAHEPAPDLKETLLHRPLPVEPEDRTLRHTGWRRLLLDVLWFATFGIPVLLVARLRGRRTFFNPFRGESRSRWAYGGVMQTVATLFILYHGVILLVHNLPGKGLAKGAQKVLNEKLDANTYWQASGNTQSWAMFAPNPHRSNVFMKVMVKDDAGEIWDLKHDIYGKREYPYLWYDRMGKINRRLIDQKGYRRHYAAWVCREWERTHEGEAADEVQFVKMWTQIPSPQAVFERAQGNIFKMGFDPMQLKLSQREEDIISCATNRQAQLPDFLRERYGLAPAPPRHFKELSVRTWWDQRESERLQAERQERLGQAAAAKGEDDDDDDGEAGEVEGAQ
jgi:hypothetical protein